MTRRTSASSRATTVRRSAPTVAARSEPHGGGRLAAWLGVDVGADRLHLALLDRHGGVALTVVPPAELPDWLSRHDEVIGGAAVDAPADWADDAHRADDRVAPKFRRRCAEAVLALRDPPHYVSWPSPAANEVDAAAHGWVATGIAVHTVLRRRGIVVDECWPHASWQRLTGRRRLPRKASADGRALRRATLVAAGLDTTSLADAGHDHLDAAVAALTAATVDARERGRAACPDAAHAHGDRGIVLPTRATL